MPANRQPRTMDNPYYDWSPISTRAQLRWPDGARVALAIIVNLDYLEMEPPPGIVVPPSVVRRGPYPAIADILETSPHEYGNRVGVFRVMQVLERYAVRGTLALDAAVAARYPYIIEQAKQRGWEFIGHGLSGSRMISEKMSEADEREYIRQSLDAVAKATGTPPQGWIGMDYGESSRTVRLLAEQGVRYVCDWPNDEQPYHMKVPAGKMVSLPTLLDLDDLYTHQGRKITMERWCQMAIDAFDRLYADGEQNARMLVFNIHPFIIGQPYRIGALEAALRHIMRHEGVWAATGSAIVDWYVRQVPAPPASA